MHVARAHSSLTYDFAGPFFGAISVGRPTGESIMHIFRRGTGGVCVFFIAVLAGAFVFGEERPKRPDSQAAKLGPNPPPNMAKHALGSTDPWETATLKARLDDIEVSVIDAVIGKVRLEEFGERALSKDPELQIKLRLFNKHATKKHDYLGWGSKLIFDEHPGHLEDNLGNKYKRISPSFGTKIVGQLVDGESLYPEKSVTDLLVFEPPVDAAEYLKLILPAEALGGKGDLHIRIDLKPKAPPPPPPPTPEELARREAARAKAVEEAKMEEAENQKRRARGRLKLGKDMLKLKKRDAARKYFQQVIDEFPDTPEADEAAKLLK